MSTRSGTMEDWTAPFPPRGQGGHRPGAAPGDDHLFDSLYAPKEKQESFLRKYGKKIAGGVACALVVSVITHLPYIKVIILWICQIILMIFGRPAGAEKLDRLEDKAIHAIEKGKQALDARAENGEIPKPAGPLAGALAAVPAVKKLKEEVHAVKEVAGTVKAAKEEAKEGVEKLVPTGHDVADALKGGVGKMKDGVEGLGAKAAEALRARKEAKEKADRDRLIVRARIARVTVDESWSAARLEAEVSLAEQIAWRKKYNARCPMPKCHYALHISDRLKRERIRCPQCNTIITGSSARALGPPPMPRRR